MLTVMTQTLLHSFITVSIMSFQRSQTSVHAELPSDNTVSVFQANERNYTGQNDIQMC